jgi:uncharacterized protein (TIGR00297 family)
MPVSDSLPKLTWSEWSRKVTHMCAFAPALLLPRLGPAWSMAMAGLLFLVNTFVLPRTTPFLYRPGERAQGALEIVLYPAAVLACLLAYSGPGGSHAWYLPPAAAWFCLAVVDACIGIGCRAFRAGPALPWNDRKPVAGFLAGLAAALAACFLAAKVFLPAAGPLQWAALGVIAVAAAFAETAWFGVADNLTVPFAVCALASLLPSPLFRDRLPALPWVTCMVPLGFGVVAYALRMLTCGGALLGGMMAFLLMVADARLFLFLGGFFALANAATRFGFSRKQARGIAEARGGRRGAAEVFGAMGAAAWMTPLVHMGGSRRAALLVCAAPFIAKTMDTVASEIGKAVGGVTVSLRTFRPVPPGSEGGVSLAGTLWGLAAAALLAAAILPLGWGNLRDTLLLVAAALAANVFESFWGEWAARRGMDHGPHTNFLMTLLAALLARIFFF